MMNVMYNTGSRLDHTPKLPVDKPLAEADHIGGGSPPFRNHAIVEIFPASRRVLERDSITLY